MAAPSVRQRRGRAAAAGLAVLSLLLGLLAVSAPASAAPLFDLLVSQSPNRSGAVPLNGQTVSGQIYVFTAPTTNVSRVRFYIDSPTSTGTPYRNEAKAPYDLAGTKGDGTANPYSTTALSVGTHTISAAVDIKTGGTEIIVATITVTRSGLSASPSTVSAALTTGTAPVTRSIAISSLGGPLAWTASSNSAWLAVSPTTGTTPATLTATLSPGSLAAGTYTGSITVAAPGVSALTIPVSMVLTAPVVTSFAVNLSLQPDRSTPVPLDGSSVTGSIYVFVTPTTAATAVRFHLDDPTASGTPLRTETGAPFDLAGTAANGTANPFSTSSLSPGTHTVTASIDRTAAAGGGTVLVTAQFTVQAQQVGAFVLSPTTLSLSGSQGGGPSSTSLSVGRDLGPGPFAITSNVAWLVASPSSGTTPSTVTITATPGTLTQGSYSGVLTVTGAGTATATVPVTYVLGAGSSCAPIACELIKVPTPTALDFRGGEGGILDGTGVGTGFTTYLRTGSGGGYLPANLVDETTSGELRIATTIGQVNGTSDAQDNMLGVGFDGGTPTVIEATLPNLPASTGKYEQAGIWFGYSQNEVMRLSVASPAAGSWQLQRHLETGGVAVQSVAGTQAIPSGTTVTLRITTDPTTRSVQASYRIGTTGSFVNLGGALAVPGAFFSFDAAGIDPAIGTRSFAGIYATGRWSSPRPTFAFTRFSLERATEPPPSQVNSGLSFDRASHPLAYPTSIATGPDGRLYVATLTGAVHVLTVGSAGQVTADTTVGTLGSRLALGIAIDPASTPSNVIVWVAHSSPSVSSGDLNSGMVTRLSGPGLTTRADVITGLPRSIANHSVNSLKFGPDGRLYIAVGGNTGAGAPNAATTEFGDRAEQPLSAALVVADVKAAGFDGTCDNGANYTAPNPCDVEVWASGLRNMYDFVFHSNGEVYGPDNGLGVVGTFPPSPTAPCFGFGDTTSWTLGGDNPGSQSDTLVRMEQGRYYGHPNPSRNECVFGNGSYQGVAPLPNWSPAMHVLGKNLSTNGVIEYSAAAPFCGRLQHDLLMTNYSTGDDVTRIQLSADGRSVVSQASLVGGFADPLPIGQLPSGQLVVGELGGSKVTVLTPRRTGCWTSAAPLPSPVLDAGGAAIGDALYVVGGKDSSGHLSTARRWTASTGTWQTLTPRPGPGLENPAVASYAGRVYAAGGSTGPFSGAVAAVDVYDPATDSWSSLPPMPTARGGAGAAVIGSRLYVVGGLADDGSSLTTVESIDLAAPGSGWRTEPALTTPRDNMAVGASGTTLVVAGGRTRLASGTTVDGTLASTEVLPAGAAAWQSRSPMPTGRRSVTAQVVAGTLYVIGGEATATNGAFIENQAYDLATDTWSVVTGLPQGRHGMASGVIDGRIHVVGGGTVAGTSYSALHTVFEP